MRVFNRVADVGVAQIALDQTKIVAALLQVITAGVAEHVGVGIELSQAGGFRQPVDQLADPPGRQPAPAFGTEDEIRRGWPLAFELAERPNLDPPEGVVSRKGTLQPPDMENPMAEVKVLPGGLQCFRNPKPVRIRDQDQGKIAGRPPGCPGRLEEPVNFRIC